MLWIAAYLAILLAGSLLVALRSEPTVLAGSSYLLFNAVFAALTVAVPLLTGRELAPVAASFFALIVLGSWMARSCWLVVHEGRDQVREAIKRCLMKVRMGYRESGGAIFVTALPATAATASGESRIGLRDLPGAVLVWISRRRRTKKLKLFERLLGKQFRPVLPRLRVRTQ